jgi:hypothetical protein
MEHLPSTGLRGLSIGLQILTVEYCGPQKQSKLTNNTLDREKTTVDSTVATAIAGQYLHRKQPATGHTKPREIIMQYIENVPDTIRSTALGKLLRSLLMVSELVDFSYAPEQILIPALTDIREQIEVLLTPNGVFYQGEEFCTEGREHTLPNYARVPDALGALPVAPLGELMEPLRTPLTVGRPISVEQQNPRPFTRCFQRVHGIL